MVLTLEQTDNIIEIQPAAGRTIVPARVWVGQTASGIRVTCFITRIAVHREDSQPEFERELRETPAPRPASLEELFPHGIPARLVLE